eukprot:m.167197 g.167197  ORF g.167197 m.167197 type:complete len:510 (-) comp15245_c0_seq11:92-1621(-)
MICCGSHLRVAHRSSTPSYSDSSIPSGTSTPLSTSPAESSDQLFDKEIKPFLQPCSFWFPQAHPAPAFWAAFPGAGAKLAASANESSKYHPCFEKAWKRAFPACKIHRLRAAGCEACSLPVYHCAAKAPLSVFCGDSPDFVFRVHDSPPQELAGAVNIKRKEGRSTRFTKGDVSRAVRHGRHILASQPLRDHATVCLFSSKLLQFFQVFRGTRIIRTTNPLLLALESSYGLIQLYSYLTAAAAAHGIRKIQVPGLFIEPNPQRLGSGSFSIVVQGLLNEDINVAVKLYQRFDLEEDTVFDTSRFDQEVTLLKTIASSSGAKHAPTVHESDKSLQFMVLSPVGRHVLFEDVDVNFVSSLVESIQALHTVCIHRDLRAANILLQPDETVMIIDWNLGLTKEQLSMPQVPAGALCVQGFDVLACMGMEEPRPHRYTHREDLQSLVRALHLLVYNVHVSPTTTAWEWADFWSWRLTGPVPPTHVFSGWVAAEAAAVAGDYDELKECFELMLAK